MRGVRVERLDHLGIVAGICREIGPAAGERGHDAQRRMRGKTIRLGWSGLTAAQACFTPRLPQEGIRKEMLVRKSVGCPTASTA